MCWDDETHFVRTISIVSMFDSVKYEAENKLVEDFPQLNQQITDKTYSYESLREYSQTLDGLYDRAHADNQEVLRPYDEATIGYKVWVEFIPLHILCRRSRSLLEKACI